MSIDNPTPEELQAELEEGLSKRTSPYLFADADTIASRNAICDACPSKGVKLGLPACNECGCYIWFTTRVISIHCDKGNW